MHYSKGAYRVKCYAAITSAVINMVLMHIVLKLVNSRSFSFSSRLFSFPKDRTYFAFTLKIFSDFSQIYSAGRARFTLRTPWDSNPQRVSLRFYTLRQPVQLTTAPHSFIFAYYTLCFSQLSFTSYLLLFCPLDAYTGLWRCCVP